MHPARPSTKHLRGALICLVLGLLASLAAAWALAAFVDIPMYPRTTLRAFVADNQAWDVTEVHKFGVLDAWWGRIDEGDPDPQKRAAHLRERDRPQVPGVPVPQILADPPAWGTLHNPAQALPAIGSDSAFGFPAPCLWYQVTGVLSQNAAGVWQVDQDELHGGILLKGELSSRGRAFHALPLRPLATGLLLDTIAFGLPVWLLLFGWPLLRRRRRLHKGLCPRCGYDLRGARATCPECGSAAGPTSSPPDTAAAPPPSAPASAPPLP